MFVSGKNEPNIKEWRRAKVVVRRARGMSQIEITREL
jgi:hypothetical protein